MTEAKTGVAARLPASRGRESENSRPRGKRRRVLLQLGLFIALAALVGYGFTRYVIAPPTSSSSVPQFVGALGLTNSVEGPEAQAEINKLHGTDITLSNAYIAQYSGRYGGAHMQVWVGQAATQSEAMDLMQRMVAGINRGGTPFSNARQETIAGRNLWQADGTDGSFFFYISQNPNTRVVWITLQHSQGTTESLLESALKVF